MSAACCLEGQPDGWTRHSSVWRWKMLVRFVHGVRDEPRKPNQIIISLSVTLSYFQSRLVPSCSSPSGKSITGGWRPQNIYTVRLTQSKPSFSYLSFLRSGLGCSTTRHVSTPSIFDLFLRTTKKSFPLSYTTTIPYAYLLSFVNDIAVWTNHTWSDSPSLMLMYSNPSLADLTQPWLK